MTDHDCEYAGPDDCCHVCGADRPPEPGSPEAALAEARGHADMLAGGIRSFLSSMPFMAPEAVGFQARVKLAGPLAEYERATAA